MDARRSLSDPSHPPSGTHPAVSNRDAQQRAARDREEHAGARLRRARERESVAAIRDAAALSRDRSAATRDAALPPAYRALVAADREAAARDRERSAYDRQRALADCEALALALAATENDALTGARTRAVGLADLEHEIDRCRRIDTPLVIAYVDAVGLKSLNDSKGQDAGDALLQRVVALIKEHLRSYDLVVRLGGDEFLCAMSNMTLADARQRFEAVAAALAAGSGGGAIRVGYADLSPEETASELIARADRQLVGALRGVARRPHDARPRTPVDPVREPLRRFSARPADHLARGTWPERPVCFAKVELPEDEASRIAREAIDLQLGPRLGERERRDLRLLVSEAVNNATSHGGGQIVMRLAMSDRHVRGEVFDLGSWPDPLPSEKAPGGFGLAIIDGLASRWGVSSQAGTCVWFEIARDSPGALPA
jgi:diguanylate cyclase (GGDEF)-like protein